MPSQPTLRDRLRTLTGGLPRPFWSLCAGTFVNRCGSFVLPFLTLYLTRVRHLSLAQAGLVLALYGAGGSVAAPLGGFLADHIGRRATLVTALALGGAGMIAVGFIQRLEVLAPAIFCVAMVTEMYRPAMQAAVADLVPPADRVRAYGLIYWVINLGFSVGLTLGGVLARASFRWLFVGDGATTLLFASVVWFGVPESRPARPPLRAGERRPSHWSEFVAPYRDRVFVRLLALSFLFALVFMQNLSTFPLAMAANGIDPATFGVILALNGVLIVLLQPFLAPALASRNRSHTIALGSVFAGIGFGLNALARTAPIYALGVILWTLGEIGVLPVANALVADLAPAQIRGRYQGAYSLSFGLAVCAAPALGSLVLERLGGSALWGGCFVLALGVALGHLGLERRLTRIREQRLGAAAG
ncbi:MAG TPA: MFS transporter [Candidatus Eisenbacteria bacterium]|jgi:MFS family permease